ncbi:MAG TPA: NAD(P)H-dependent oxidoreductase [Frankiaceae bacterium]|jgi:FMN-dependent NADH-azoreductase|nr:NAD(P)H-dependent oxidoreductase [Frankiaceae bacterium]
MTLFRLDASIRTEGSHSRQIADLVESEWRDANPQAHIIRRHVGTEPIPATAWAAAVSAAGVDRGELTDEQRAGVDLAASEVDSLLQADAALFAVPLYNFGVSQHFKSWVDLVITDPRMAPAGTPGTAGMPAVLVVVRGGSYAAGTPRDGWDHATGWMRRILEDVWQFDLRVVEREFTLVGVNPALDAFADVAVDMRHEAERVAREHGRALGVARVAA